MPRNVIETLTCDLCQFDSQPRDGKSPKGWIKLCVDDKWEERSWHDVFVCPNCIKSIQIAIQKQTLTEKNVYSI